MAESSFPQEFINVILSIHPKDVVDILLVTYVIYKAFTIVRETRAMQLFKGILLLLGLYALVSWIQLDTMKYLMEQVFQVGLFALFVVFQPELRRGLEQAGRTKISDVGIFGGARADDNLEEHWNQAITCISDASNSLSRQKVGALMVLERKTRLGEIIKTGTIIDSTPSAELIGNIFFHNSPLHDGAMVIRDGRLHAAGCYLPLSDNHEISREMGTRHRAGLGMSENSDAVVVIVSEETGNISVAMNGQITRDYTPETLKELLLAEILPEKKTNDSGEKKQGFWKGKNKHEEN